MSFKSIVSSIFTSLLLLTPTQLFAATCTAQTDAQTISLLDLTTSEGCSSCPSADKWLSNLTPNPSLYVALAFHVDYWDYIGWHDRFSKAQFSDRQRKIAALNHTGFVYTPQFVLNGKDFKSGDDHYFHSKIAKQQKLPTRATLSLNTTTDSNGRISLNATAQLTNNQEIKQAEVFLALYENKLETQVKAGENNGRLLKHDYVVRELFGAFPISAENQFIKQFKLDEAWKNKNAGAVLFVQDANNGEVLQSLQLAFCD